MWRWGEQEILNWVFMYVERRARKTKMNDEPTSKKQWGQPLAIAVRGLGLSVKQRAEGLLCAKFCARFLLSQVLQSNRDTENPETKSTTIPSDNTT